MKVESRLEIRLLGGFEARVDGTLVPAAVWRQRRAAAIVKLLALESSRTRHREQLLDLLWPDLDPESAANNLRVALHHARLGLERAGAPAGVFLLREGELVVLGPRDRTIVDVETFAEAARSAWETADPAAAIQAAELYTGDLLPEDPYEDWASSRREGLRATHLSLLTRLAELHEARGEIARAIAAQERILRADPLDESGHLALIRLHARMGNREVALGHYARLQSLLERELGTTPSSETEQLVAAIREGRVKPASWPDAQVLAQQTPTPDLAAGTRLPAPVGALIGRERELAELDRLLTVARLVTLTGAGGIGKTRLAVEVARAREGQHPDRIVFVDLASLRDPTLVLTTIARAVGVAEAGDRPIVELVASTIGERCMLLLLDNLEHLTSVAEDLAGLLAVCPQLNILATSRVRLHLRGEHEYPVLPLALPTRDSTDSVASLTELSNVAAIELFTQRATQSRSGFTLTDQNIEAVIEICRQLDGVPLAIELAAAQIRALTPAQVLRRLERPLDILGTTAADVPDRQRTLRNTIAWSHDLLASAEQVLFRRLSVFAGGWSLEGTEAIASVSGTSSVDALQTLERLIDHSLVEARPVLGGAELRYSMLETTREFAIEQLAAGGEIVLVERAFEDFLESQARAAAAGLKGPDQLLWLERLEVEHDNLRAAMGRALDRSDGATALGLALLLWEFWWIRGYRLEGRAWLERCLSLAGNTSERDRAAAEFALGRLSFDLGDYTVAEQHLGRSLQANRRLRDALAESEVLSMMAMIAVNRLDYDAARLFGEQALAISREAADLRRTATALRVLGMVAREQGEHRRALTLFEESMALGEVLDDPAWKARIATQLGITHRLAGNAEQAQGFFEISRNLHTELQDRFALAVIANNSGHLAFDAGEVNRAIALYEEALQHFVAVGEAEGVVEAIEWLAVAAAAKGVPTRALRLFGAAKTARRELALPPRLEADEKRAAEGLNEATSKAGPSAQAAFDAGSALGLEAARDEALVLAGDAVDIPPLVC